MNSILLLMTWVFPLALASVAGLRLARWSTVVAPLPALVAALALPAGHELALPWLLLGVELGLDDTGRIFLLFSAMLWMAAGLYLARDLVREAHGVRFRVFFLLAMSGNLGLITSQDMLSFFLGFTLMGLAASGLVAHSASEAAVTASRRYLAWTIAGELVLFTAIVRLAAQNDGVLDLASLHTTDPDNLTTLLLVAGFGIKLALPGLHLWLPSAYAAAPIPAVAVLSGAMIKAGLLGWLRFLPPGNIHLTEWGQALIAIGVIGILFGSIAGLRQREPRLLLGYSSIGKMGVLTCGFGAALHWPAAAPVLVGALAIYAAHHSLVKGALFLGLGFLERGIRRWWILGGLGFLGFALAGAPLTSGAIAKAGLTSALPTEGGYLAMIFAVSAFATSLLMLRLMYLLARTTERSGLTPAIPPAAAWLTLLVLVALFPLLPVEGGELIANVVPISLAIVLGLTTLLVHRCISGGQKDRLHQTAKQPTRAGSLQALPRQIPTMLLEIGEMFSSWHIFRNPWWRRQRYQKVRLPGSLKGLQASHFPVTGGLWLLAGGLLLAAFTAVR